VINYVKLKILDDYALQSLWVPRGVTTKNGLYIKKHFKKIPQCEIYVSQDFFENKTKLLCIIQGTGNVRAG
jgi:hypothetical protein